MRDSPPEQEPSGLAVGHILSRGDTPECRLHAPPVYSLVFPSCASIRDLITCPAPTSLRQTNPDRSRKETRALCHQRRKRTLAQLVALPRMLFCQHPGPPPPAKKNGRTFRKQFQTMDVAHKSRGLQVTERTYSHDFLLIKHRVAPPRWVINPENIRLACIAPPFVSSLYQRQTLPVPTLCPLLPSCIDGVIQQRAGAACDASWLNVGLRETWSDDPESHPQTGLPIGCFHGSHPKVPV